MPSSAVIIGGIALYIVELRVDEPSITNLEDAFWLTITTMTTVGYGEIYLQTTEGRIVASFLLFAGILTFFGFLSTIASTIIKPTLEVKAKQKEEKEEALCEICGENITLPRKPGIARVGMNEYHKDGTIKIHNACSKHIVDLYDRLVEEIRNK